MKTLWTLVLVLAGFTGYTQDGDLPLDVKSAFDIKYQEARLDNWWVENELYYFDYILNGGSYIAVFDEQGNWRETAETISELEVPGDVNEYIRSNFPTGKICICEKVESAENQKYLRVSLIEKGNISRVLSADLDGKNIAVL
jgi:hypothetical protein